MSVRSQNPKVFKNAMALTSPAGGGKIRSSIKKVTNDDKSVSKLSEEAAKNFAFTRTTDGDILNFLKTGRTTNDARAFATASSSSTAWSKNAGTVGVSGLIAGKSSIVSDPSKTNYNINPDVYDKIDNFKDYYGWNNPGGNGFRKPWDGIGGGENPWDNFKETQVKGDSKLLDLTSNERANDVWNDVRARLIDTVFADDESLNKALNKSIDKLDGFKEAQLNADSLSLTAAYNLSEKGIKEHGVGKIMEAYSEVSNYLPEGILTKAYLQKLSSVSEGQDMVNAIKEAKNYDTRDYGGLELSETQVKATADKLNRTLFNNIAEAMDLDANKLVGDLDKNGFSNHKHSMYNLNGATILAAALDGNLDKTDANGKTGYQKLMEQSESKYGGDFKANMTVFLVNRAYDTDGEDNTDGSAFGSTEEGMTGLASLLKHKGGLTDNPFAPNEFTLAFNDSKKMKEGLISHLQAANEAGLNVNKTDVVDKTKSSPIESLKLVVRGHGSEEGDTMINSGTHGKDYDGFGVKDSAFFKDILENAPGLKELNICYDSCYGKKSAEANAQAANKAAKELGMNIAIVNHGSTTFGLVDSHQVADSDNGRSQMDKKADGQLAVNRKRHDHAGKTDVIYSQGKEKFMARMQESAEENKELIAKHDASSDSNLDTNKTNENSGSEILAANEGSNQETANTDDEILDDLLASLDISKSKDDKETKDASPKEEAIS